MTRAKKRLKMRAWWLIGLLVVTLLAGCGGSDQAAEAGTPSLAATEAAAAASPTPLPSATVQPESLAEAADGTPEATLEPEGEPTRVSSELDVPALQVGSAAPTPAAAPARNVSDPQLPVRLTIPSLGIDFEPVPVGLDENRIPIVPKHDVGWYTLSAKPGAGDNVVFWGHVLRWKDSPDVPAPFAALEKVQVGAQVLVRTADGTVRPYRVSKIVWARPDQVQYILPVGSEQVTLVSCIGDRVIVDGSLELSHRQITIAVPAETN